MTKTAIILSLGCFFMLNACADKDATDGVVALNGSLTQLSGPATEAECPNGGVTLEHGIDKNADGQLNLDEVLNTYVLCHGKDGSVADTATLQAELATLKAAVALNTAKAGITGDQIRAIEENTTKAGITTAQIAAITTNTAKTGITQAQATAITANTAKAGITQAQATAITANTAKAGITAAQTMAIDTNTTKTGITQAQATAINNNSAMIQMHEVEMIYDMSFKFADNNRKRIVGNKLYTTLDSNYSITNESGTVGKWFISPQTQNADLFFANPWDNGLMAFQLDGANLYVAFISKADYTTYAASEADFLNLTFNAAPPHAKALANPNGSELTTYNVLGYGHRVRH